ncbi:WecB/TagA/CpsF family glycosyltransferase [Modicisalibacter sp. 'Wilcox']|uniref:WecB/TagA/CpsF family glycosyltransferase n=1 Tax=Modicisalibacter sp. 'Wilcox' TaxID=2679914 RepID=UPI0013D643B3|nr:WecB/TagA/CpsF family glycosyltransferase [Modicisalibacter sp. 'Wilcox']
MPDCTRLFGLDFPIANVSETAELVAQAIDRRYRFQVVTPNLEYIYWQHHNPELGSAMHAAEIVTPDGMPLVWLSRVPGGQRKPLPGRVTGADLLPALCRLGGQRQWRIMLLGGAPGVAEKAAERLVDMVPDLPAPQTLAPDMNFERDPCKEQRVIESINSYRPHLLAIAMGCPRQECWIRKVLSRLDANAVIGVGASLDFLAGNQRRAPMWMQNAGLEWLWRFSCSPRRLGKRYLLTYPRSIPLVIRELARHPDGQKVADEPWWRMVLGQDASTPVAREFDAR